MSRLGRVVRTASTRRRFLAAGIGLGSGLALVGILLLPGVSPHLRAIAAINMLLFFLAALTGAAKTTTA